VARQTAGRGDRTRFQTALERLEIRHPIAHDSYLINLASPDEELWQKSVDAMFDELVRCDFLGIAYLVAHPGAFTTSSEEEGIARVAKGLDAVHRRGKKLKAQILLETTAGQGSTLGWRFEQLGAIIEQTREESGWESALTPATCLRPAIRWRRKRNTPRRWPSSTQPWA